MGGRRSLRRRYRDESTVATLMEVPTWLFLAVLLGGVLLVIVIAAGIDIYRHTPDVVLNVLIPILLLPFFGGLFWLSSRDRLLRQRRLEQTSTAQRLMALMPDEMADIAAEMYRLQGYAVTENKRPDLEDGGVDFEATKAGKTWLVQVKHWRQEVTVKEARELWGIVASERAAGGILIGTSGFTSRAREFAEGKDLVLIDGPEFLKLRSGLPTLERSADGAADPMVSQGFVVHFAGVHRPACPNCGKPMVLVTRLEDAVVVRQFWGCSAYPTCDGTRRFAFPYLPTVKANSGTTPLVEKKPISQ
jgi:restriction system protein